MNYKNKQSIFYLYFILFTNNNMESLLLISLEIISNEFYNNQQCQSIVVEIQNLEADVLIKDIRFSLINGNKLLQGCGKHKLPASMVINKQLTIYCDEKKNENKIVINLNSDIVFATHE